MPNIERLNETLRKQIAMIVAEEIHIEGGLITISRVDCDPNYYSAKVSFSILPDNMIGTALEKLKKNSGLIAAELKNRIRMRKIPHFIWEFDPTEKKAGALDKVFQKIEDEKNADDEDIENITFKY
jgi:ribosome-binding factor A